MLYVVNYADGSLYEKYQKYCSLSARILGKADKIVELKRNDIDADYIKEHNNIFSYNRGAGLWLWKPYLIDKTLNKIKDNDWLFYTDSGSFFIRDIHKLIKCAEKNNTDIMLFEQPMLNRQFCKKETAVLMGVEDKGENQTLGIMLIKKTENTIGLIKEWKNMCQREELLSPKIFHPEIEEYKDFYEHREDQSIMSLLRTKYNILSFRDCSDYGVFPFDYYNPKWKYNPLKYNNSDYPTILLCNRKCHPIKYLLLYFIKIVMKFFNVYTEERKIKKVNKKFEYTR